MSPPLSNETGQAGRTGSVPDSARIEGGGLRAPPIRWYCRALLRAGICGKPALPSLLGRGVNLAGPSGYWVGHSSGSFAVGLMSDREPGLASGSRGYTGRRAVSGQFLRRGAPRTGRRYGFSPRGPGPVKRTNCRQNQHPVQIAWAILLTGAGIRAGFVPPPLTPQALQPADPPRFISGFSSETYGSRRGFLPPTAGGSLLSPWRLAHQMHNHQIDSAAGDGSATRKKSSSEEKARPPAGLDPSLTGTGYGMGKW